MSLQQISILYYMRLIDREFDPDHFSTYSLSNNRLLPHLFSWLLNENYTIYRSFKKWLSHKMDLLLVQRVPSLNSPGLHGQGIYPPILTICPSKLHPVPHQQFAYIHNPIKYILFPGSRLITRFSSKTC